MQFHGDFGPGGIQAGVIVAAGSLYGIISGLETTRKVVPSAVESDARTGLITRGRNVGILAAAITSTTRARCRPLTGQHRAFWVEVGVAVPYRGRMLKILYNFGGRGQDPSARISNFSYV